MTTQTRLSCAALLLAAIVCCGEELSVQPLEGKPFAATLSSLADGKATFQTAEGPRELNLADLVVFGQPADARRASCLLLRDGSKLVGEIRAVAAQTVTLASARRPGIWNASELPRGSVHALVWQTSSSTTVQEKFELELLEAKEASDRLLLVGGDTLTGQLIDLTTTDMDATALRIVPQGGKEPLVVPLERVVATIFGASAPHTAAANPFWLGFADGSLVLSRKVKVEDDTVTVDLAVGGRLTASLKNDDEPPASFWDHVKLLQLLGPRVAYLSDLKTLGFKHVPLLSWQRDYTRDRALTGAALRVDRRRYVKGLGMPGTSRIAYDIPPGMQRFRAEAAIDDAAGRGGAVIFRVFLEGEAGAWQPAQETGLIRGGDAPRPISVELGKAKRLALVVDMAAEGDQLDYADWLNARFEK
jgi:hypothetical protein